jgi:Tol biopolymer transport system component
VTTAAPPDIAPVWMPDGKQIIFSSGPAGQDNLFRQAADGPGVTEQLSKNAKVRLLANAVLPDGSRLFVTVQELSGVYDLGILDLAGDRRTELVTQTPNFNEQNADLSPDARFVAYQSNESGQSEIFLRPFPDTKGLRHLVSIAGGTRPLWARSGRELFYLTAGGALMAVPVQTTPTLTVGTPVKLFEGPYFRGLNLRTYDVSPDGLRFLMIKEVGSGEDTSERPRIIIVQNWFEELKRLVPTN